jgi:hypothetical protein
LFFSSFPSHFLQMTFPLSPLPFSYSLLFLPFFLVRFLSSCSSVFLPFSSSSALAPFSIPYTLSSPGTFFLTSFSPFYSHSFFFLLLSPLPSVSTLDSGS